MNVFLVGDSDIDRWPPYLVPGQGWTGMTHTVCGKSGATLQQVVPLVEQRVQEVKATSDAGIAVTFFVVCAGEKDLSSGGDLVESEQALKDLIQAVFSGNTDSHRYLIFLGPKFEPWLQHDKSARRQYIRMSERFKQVCTHDSSLSLYVQQHTTYIDCLTMFCGASGHLPGALWGGKAIAESLYFHSDQLHLSDQGYEIWKLVIEDCVTRILTNEGVVDESTM